MLNYKIIAVDFDGTLCENKWPEIGEPNLELITHLKQEKASGAKLILWTCRVDELLSAAITWCDNDHQLQFDMINGNLPEVIREFGSDTRKIFAHEYIDDKMSGRFGLPFVKAGITDDTIEKLENVYGFSMYDWQKRYLKGDDTAMPSGGRGNGKTFTHCVRLLLEDPGDRPTFDLSNWMEVQKLVDENHGAPYNHFFHNYLREMNQKLIDAGFKTNVQKRFSTSLNNNDIKTIENFLSKVDPTIAFLEMQSIVRMQYDIYKRMMMPATILNT